MVFPLLRTLLGFNIKKTQGNIKFRLVILLIKLKNMRRSIFIYKKVLSIQRVALLLLFLIINSLSIGQSITNERIFTDSLTSNVNSNTIYSNYTIKSNEIIQNGFPNFNYSTDTSFKETLKPINKKRIVLISGLGLSALGASYAWANNAWWNGRKKSFHLDKDANDGSIFSIFKGPDEKYAKNLDKIAHFWGGVVYSDLFSYLLSESNVPTKKAALFGALAGCSIQGFIEIKDGFAYNWGFSVLDVTAGSLGSFYSYTQNFVPVLAATDIKISYFRRDDYYFTVYQDNPNRTWDEDYMNMTFWASYNPYRLISHGKRVHPNWPKWLSISAGIGVDNTLDSYYTGLNLPQNKGKGKYEFYLAPDIDFTGIFPKNKHFQAFAKVINRVKFPMPTLRLSPSLTFYPVYF